MRHQQSMLRRAASAALPNVVKRLAFRGFALAYPLYSLIGRNKNGQLRRKFLTFVSVRYCRRLLLPKMQFSDCKVLDNAGYKSVPSPQISILILNRNGLNYLQQLLPSLLQFEKESSVEIILVDHGSIDGSSEYVLSNELALPIRLLQFKANNTFAFANNLAAQHARGQTLVLMNNDLVLDEPLLETMASTLYNDNLGVVGAALYYPDDAGQRSNKLQHSGIILEQDHFYQFARPINWQLEDRPERPVVAVTAALLMCRKADYLRVGGLHKDFIYGYEDVDFCLRVARKLGKRSGLTKKVAAIHNESASQANTNDRMLAIRRRHNIELFRQRHASSLVTLQQLAGLQLKQQRNCFKVGLAVTEADSNTRAGDVFTAQELATALQSELGWQTVLLAERCRDHDWYDLNDVDLLIVLLDHYDLSRTYNQTEGLIMACWGRNWFNRWSERPWFKEFDLKLASSIGAAHYFSSKSESASQVLRIGTNEDRFSPAATHTSNNTGQFSSDYCFTGSYWGADRDIEQFRPKDLPYEFALYGEGWEKHEQFEKHHRGFLAYENMPDVYRGTKLLIDDANHVTKPWGSVNSRVFDGLVAGAMVISNGAAGVKETFKSQLPCYSNAEELRSLVNNLLSDEQKRTQLQTALRNEVLGRHTYRHRAKELHGIVQTSLQTQHRIAIKIAVPHRGQQDQWGDFHFASALQRELIVLGHRCRIDILPEWYGRQTRGDDTVIVLRGLSEYKPDDFRLNLLWMISHPDKVDAAELKNYDHVFVASKSYAETLKKSTGLECSTLLQCTDPTRFNDNKSKSSGKNILFVGNSRKQKRPIVQHAIDAGLDVSVYGTHWQGRIPTQFLRDQHVDNALLGGKYSQSGAILNDHWPSMREHGFISNRLFDAAASGATIVSDSVAGIDEVFDGLVYTYADTAEDLKRQVTLALEQKSQMARRRSELAAKVAKLHSFSARARALHNFIIERDSLRKIDSTNSGAADAWPEHSDSAPGKL